MAVEQTQSAPQSAPGPGLVDRRTMLLVFITVARSASSSLSWPRSPCRVRPGLHPVIDYLGIVFVSIGAAGLTLALSWGGTEYAWSPACPPCMD